MTLTQFIDSISYSPNDTDSEDEIYEPPEKISEDESDEETFEEALEHNNNSGEHNEEIAMEVDREDETDAGREPRSAGGDGGGGSLGNFNFPDSYQESFKGRPQQLKVNFGPQVFKREFSHSIGENKHPGLKQLTIKYWWAITNR